MISSVYSVGLTSVFVSIMIELIRWKKKSSDKRRKSSLLSDASSRYSRVILS